MRRAAIFMADAARSRVRAVGSHGTSFEQLSELRPTLVDTPIAQQALERDEVVVVSERIEEAVPPEYARVLGITTLVCTPLSAAGRGYGVICADRGGGRFELSDGERHLLWTLGKTEALVATARNVTRQQERARRLSERLEAGESGADLCESIRAASPTTRVLLISGAGRISPHAARAAGPSGFVSKDWKAHDVAMAVRMVGWG